LGPCLGAKWIEDTGLIGAELLDVRGVAAGCLQLVLVLACACAALKGALVARRIAVCDECLVAGAAACSSSSRHCASQCCR
jgi:hypothetical protein